MTLAYDYPLASILLTTLLFFLFIVWLMALWHVFGDIFRSDDMGAFAKFVWVIFVVFMPFLGVFVYLVARGDRMTQHAVENAQARDAAFQSYVQDVASPSFSEQLNQLAALRDAGTITPEEYATAKAKTLS